MRIQTKQFDCIYANGCSWTFGSELRNPDHPNVKSDFSPQHDTYRQSKNWATLLATGFNVPVHNGSVAGGSNDRILRTSIKDINRLVQQGHRPFVVIAWSQLHRFELPKPNDDWRPFVGPSEDNLPVVAEEIFGRWSSDYSDVERWIMYLITLDAFLKSLGLDYLASTVFSESYRLYEQKTVDQYFEANVNYLKNQKILKNHLLHYSLESYLKQHEGVSYGPGGHPLERGHELIKDYFRQHMLSQFQFQR